MLRRVILRIASCEWKEDPTQARVYPHATTLFPVVIHHWVGNEETLENSVARS